MVKILTARDIAEYLRVSYESALLFIKTSGVKYFKVGNQYRVLSIEFEGFINRIQLPDNK